MCVFLDCFNYYSSFLFSIFAGLSLEALPTCFYVNHMFLCLQPGFWALLPSQLGPRSEPPGDGRGPRGGTRGRGIRVHTRLAPRGCRVPPGGDADVEVSVHTRVLALSAPSVQDGDPGSSGMTGQVSVFHLLQ